MEGSSKAQIITPRAITPTNESSNKKKKTENNNNNENNKLKASGQSTSNLQSLNKQPTAAVAKAKESPPKTSMLSQNEIFGDDLNLSDDGSDMD